MTTLYNEHFGFHERPFSLSPDPDFLFWSRGHQRALSVLEYGIMTHAPLTIITGEVGTGKTTLIQALLNRLNDNVTVGLISNARSDQGNLLNWILNAFDIPAPVDGNYVHLFARFEEFVLSQYAVARHVVLIVDEAQNLGPALLEELRLLTNINSHKDDILQIIMVGQNELRDIICQPELRQFAQRVSATYNLTPMDFETTIDYITHRLKHAGGTGQEFTPEAIALIYEETAGIPRMINKICDLSLVYASSTGDREVSLETVEELVQDGLILKPNPPLLLLHPQFDDTERAAE
jgi:type II secretory pathway predicted ATPase ExeA